MRRLTVVGLGNTYLTDDGVGICVAKELKRRIRDCRVTIREVTGDSLDVIEAVENADEAVIIDAVKNGAIHGGGVCTSPLYNSSPPTVSKNLAPGRPFSVHTINLQTALLLRKSAGAHIPDKITLFGINAVDTETFHEGCTPDLRRAIPEIVLLALEFIRSRIPDLKLRSSKVKPVHDLPFVPSMKADVGKRQQVQPL
ncbi:MAG TPA: hydrogenase maturation protease [Bacteroidota bacterium]|nr:hydrogenase maturation protease [Bacteroidota bacterium]